jgi:hypothetical protein
MESLFDTVRSDIVGRISKAINEFPGHANVVCLGRRELNMLRLAYNKEDEDFEGAAIFGMRIIPVRVQAHLSVDELVIRENPLMRLNNSGP